MTEINNNPDMKITQSKANNVQPEFTKKSPSFEGISKDYKEAAAAPGAEAAGRAMVNISKSHKADNIQNDIQRILDNPKLLDRSELLFSVAEREGIPYPEAATFATSELG